MPHAPKNFGTQFQATAPNKAPAPAVTNIAAAPQDATRQVALQTGAPPTRAERAPRPARNASDDTETQRVSCAGDAVATTAIGSTAPTEKLAAEAHAA